MKQKGFALLSVLVVFLVVSIVGIIGLSLWQQGQISTSTPPAPTESVDQSTKVPPTCESDNLSVDIETYSTLPTRIVTVSIKGLNGEEIRSARIENVPSNLANYSETGKCYFYLKRTVGQKTELWRYNFDLKGEKIYESESGFSFDISSSEKFLAINNDLEVLVIVIDSGEQIKKITIDSLKKPPVNTQPTVLEGSISLRGWNEGESELWGSLFSAAFVEAFWKLDINSGKTEVFSELFNPTPNGILLNPDREVYAVTDRPVFFDAEGYEAWKNSTENYSIYVYSLRSKTSTLVDTLPSSWQSPRSQSGLIGWDSPTKLRYSTPDGEKVYTFNN